MFLRICCSAADDTNQINFHSSGWYKVDEENKPSWQIVALNQALTDEPTNWDNLL